jgi:hypothetical protein
MILHIDADAESDGVLVGGGEEGVTQEVAIQAIGVLMAKVVELPDFNPATFQARMMAALMGAAKRE